MPENMNPNEQKHYDDELARFADRVISGERPDVPEMAGNNQELAELMETVVSLERVIGSERPDPAMAKRIKANLMKEWEMSGPAAERDSFWKRLWSAGGAAPQRQLTGLVTAVGVVALVVVASTLFLSIPLGGLPGSAPGGVPTALVVGGLVVLAGVLWWLSRSQR